MYIIWVYHTNPIPSNSYITSLLSLSIITRQDSAGNGDTQHCRWCTCPEGLPTEPQVAHPKRCPAAGLLFHYDLGWLVVYLPLWKIGMSIRMIIPNIWKNIKCSKPPISRWAASFMASGQQESSLEKSHQHIYEIISKSMGPESRCKSLISK